MARSVISATCGLIPSSSASSSMHSCSIMVESMSAISSCLRRPSVGTSAASIGRLPMMARALASASVDFGSTISQAMSGFSQVSSPPTASATSVAMAVSSSGSAGFAMRQRTGMATNSGGDATGTRRAVLIAGPTASGKSALALRRARDEGAVIVNADAMQVYDTLQILTARPSAGDEKQADHRLYDTV